MDMTAQNRVPAHKGDIARAQALSKLDPTELLEIMPLLVIWLQDSNWPVFMPVAVATDKLGAKFAPFVREVLRGDDDCWKYSMLVVASSQRDVAEEIKEDLLRIYDNPTKGEIDEMAAYMSGEILMKFFPSEHHENIYDT
jgi:hypothetical protein